jgi:3-hydroxybutyrate dehydrogenase
MGEARAHGGELAGKSALITGSLGGIGFAVACRLAALGCDVMLNGFADTDTIDERRSELTQRFGVRAAHHSADLRDPAQIAALVRDTATAHGGVDILVNNAVVRYFGPVEAFEPAHWDEALAVNVSAPFHAIRAALPGMRERGWGRIVNIASIYGLFATVNRIDYITTKTALIGMTRGVALEVAKSDITCNAICPGTVLTPAIERRVQDLVTQEGIPREAALSRFVGVRQPSGRFVEADNVAGLVGFLCGLYGADINGAALPIDGAWTAGR